MSLFDLIFGRDRSRVRRPKRPLLHMEQLGGRVLPGAVPYPMPWPDPPPPPSSGGGDSGDSSTTDGGTDTSTSDSGSSTP